MFSSQGFFKCRSGAHYLASCEVYDPVQNTWRDLPPMEEGRCHQHFLLVMIMLLVCPLYNQVVCPISCLDMADQIRLSSTSTV